MTVGHVYYDWQDHQPAPDPARARCSPNLLALGTYLMQRWKLTSLGCYGWRPVRAGVSPSSHGFGAAIDRRYAETIGRARALLEVLPFLIDHSHELHISAIHDYAGGRIWHAGRGWKDQQANPSTGMGQAWAGYFHIETTLSGWDDYTAIAWRLGIIAPSKPELAVTIDPPTVEENDDMNTARMVREKGYLNVWLVGAGPALQLSPELAASYMADRIPMVEQTHPQMLKAMLHQSGLTAADLVAGGP